MIVLALALAAGCLVGYMGGGRLHNVARVRLRSWPLILAALAAQVGAGVAPRALRGPLAVGCCIAVTVWCLTNHAQVRVLPGMAITALGLTANAVVIAANGGMPVDGQALVAAGFSPTLDVARGHLYKHVVMTAASRLRDLGDVVPIRVFHTVASPGDLAMLAGLFLVAWGATTVAADGPTRTMPDERARPGAGVAA